MSKLSIRYGPALPAIEWSPHAQAWELLDPHGRLLYRLPHGPDTQDRMRTLMRHWPDLAAGGARRERALRAIGR